MTTQPSVLHNTMEYLGLRQSPPGDLDTILTQVVTDHGTQVYFDEAQLEAAMREHGANDTQILQTRLMSHVPGLPELLDPNAQTSQIDLDRLVVNAVESTGLHRTVILAQAAAIAASAGIAFRYTGTPQDERALRDGKAFVIPGSLYEKELETMDVHIAQGELPPAARTRLEALAAAGIPAAQARLGAVLLREKDAPSVDAALQLLEEAAQAGDSYAAGVLGDFYYQSGKYAGWTHAYRYYTGYGAPALTPTRRDALVNILNRKIFNRRSLVIFAVLALVMLAVTLLAPGTALFAPCLALGVVCFVLAAAAVVVGFLHFRVRPYDSVQWVLWAILGLWVLHLALRLIIR